MRLTRNTLIKLTLNTIEDHFLKLDMGIEKNHQISSITALTSTLYRDFAITTNQWEEYKKRLMKY